MSGRTQIFYCSTQLGLVIIIAQLRSGTFDVSNEVARRILIISNNNLIPELKGDQIVVGGIEPVYEHWFERTVYLNDLIFPLHPHEWDADGAHALSMSRLFRAAIGVAAVDDIVVETLTSAPALTFAKLLPESEIYVFGEGLMVYGPSRRRIPSAIGRRVVQISYIDLVGGLRPLLLSEFAVPLNPIGRDDFLSALRCVHINESEDTRLQYEGACVVIGQYLSAINLTSIQEENNYYYRIIRTLYNAGERRIVFRSHPSVPLTQIENLRGLLGEFGDSVTISRSKASLEGILLESTPRLVCGLFSTALVSAAALFGIPSYSHATRDLLNKLRPFQNSNRIPIVLAHALLPDIDTYTGSPAVALLDTERSFTIALPTAFAMQPEILADRKNEARFALDEGRLGPDAKMFTATVIRNVAGAPAAAPKLPEDRAGYPVAAGQSTRFEKKLKGGDDASGDQGPPMVQDRRELSRLSDRAKQLWKSLGKA